jgi:hypothetical protein
MGLPTFKSPEQKVAEWISQQEEKPRGLDSLIKGFLLANPKSLFSIAPGSEFPNPQRWATLSKSLLEQNEGKLCGTANLRYPRSLFESQLSRQMLEQFEAFARSQGVVMDVIEVRKVVREDDGLGI